jgi:SnoaL-like domain
MTTQEIANQLVAFCRKGEWESAQKALYATDAVSIEPQDSPAFAKETKGLDAIIAKGHTFNSMVEQYHSIKVSEPLVTDDALAITLEMDLTMKGRGRTPMSEIAVYKVKDGKIVSEQFFY